jgi:Zn-finger nucleic acid-binding protein
VRRAAAVKLRPGRADTGLMNCPACGHVLSSRTAGDVTVDVCDGGCGGIWFDHYELRKLDEPSAAAGEALLEVPRNPTVVVDPAKRYSCPKCTDGVVMMRHFWSVKREVTIDECPECGGVFLDAGELARIRSEFPSDAARHAAADAYFAEVVDPILDGQRAEDRVELERAQRFAHAFRFITPSWYVPGKQEGAAF